MRCIIMLTKSKYRNKFQKELHEEWELLSHQCKLIGRDILNLPVEDFLKLCLMTGFVLGGLSYLRHLIKYHM